MPDTTRMIGSLRNLYTSIKKPTRSTPPLNFWFLILLRKGGGYSSAEGDFSMFDVQTNILKTDDTRRRKLFTFVLPAVENYFYVSFAIFVLLTAGEKA